MGIIHAACLVRRFGHSNKAPIKVSGKTILTVMVGIVGALLLGVGMCLVMLAQNLVPGIAVGIIGIVVLMMLIPLIKGLK